MFLLIYFFLDMQRSIVSSWGMLFGELLAWGPALTDDLKCVRLKCDEMKKKEEAQ